MYGYIYKTTNLVNQKIYIGQHKSSSFVGKRYLGSGVLLRESIKKYGEDNFIVEMIDTADSSEELDLKEQYWIAHYNSRDKSIGYNCAVGGMTGNTGCPQSDYQKSVVRDYMTNREISDTTRHKMSESAKNRCKHNGGYVVNQRGKIIVHKGTKNTTIRKEELDDYISQGYVRGQYVSEEWKQRMKHKYSTGTYINKEGKIKFVDFSELKQFTDCGWKVGRK